MTIAEPSGSVQAPRLTEPSGAVAAAEIPVRGGSRTGFLAVLNRAIARFVASPILFRWRRLIVVKFGLLSGFALALGIVGLLLGSQVLGLADQTRFLRRFLIGLPVVIVVGSIVLFWPLRWRQIREDPRELGAVAFCFYGGFVGSIALVMVIPRGEMLSLLAVADFIVVVLPLFHGLSRLACLNYGCCCGQPKRGTRGLEVRYFHSEAKVNRMGGEHGQALHPVQLYEAAVGLVMTPLLAAVYVLVPFAGATLCAYLLGYGVSRCVLETLRISGAHERWQRLSVWQWLAMVQAAAGVALILAWQPLERRLTFDFSVLIDGSALLEAAVYGAWALAVLSVGYGIHVGQVGRWTSATKPGQPKAHP